MYSLSQASKHTSSFVNKGGDDDECAPHPGLVVTKPNTTDVEAALTEGSSHITTKTSTSNGTGSGTDGLTKRKIGSTAKTNSKGQYSAEEEQDERIAKLEEQVALLSDKLLTKIDKRGLEIRLNKGDLMTQFAGKWFSGVLAFAVLLFYAYYIVRGDQAPIDQTKSRKVIYISCFCGIYLFMTLFDIMHVTFWPDKVKCAKNTDHTHVIVAAHRAADSLRSMLPSILQTFHPTCVWVADNGYFDEETQQICKELGVNYRFNSYGNKANALLVVARHIQRTYGNKVKNVMLLDDDTILADDFFIRHDLLEPDNVGGYCVGIGVQRSDDKNIWEIVIDYEYRSISYSMQARAAKGTMRFAHGIAAVYKLDKMVELYQKNPALPGGLPFGEDGWAGIVFRSHGYKIVQDNANCVLTFCPRRFFPPGMCMAQSRLQGYGADSLVKQRGQRWYMNWIRHLPHEFKLFLTYNARSCWGNIAYRIYMLYWLFLNATSVAWLPYWILIFLNKELSFWFVLQLKLALLVTSVVVAWIRVLAFPPKLVEGIYPFAPFLAPVLGIGKTFLRLYAFFNCILWYLPFRRIGKLEVLGDEHDLDYPPMVIKVPSTVSLSPTEIDDDEDDLYPSKNDSKKKKKQRKKASDHSRSRRSSSNVEEPVDDTSVMSSSSLTLPEVAKDNHAHVLTPWLDLPLTSINEKRRSTMDNNKENNNVLGGRIDQSGSVRPISNGPSRRYESLNDTAYRMASLSSMDTDGGQTTDDDESAHVIDV